MDQAESERKFEDTRNLARFFAENRQIAWVLLVVVAIWGVYGYLEMPKRKDPLIPVRVATAITPWPGVDAEKIEQLVTRQVESTIAENASIHGSDPNSYGVQSLTLPGVSIVQLQLSESVNDTSPAFSDINLKLEGLNSSLPEGAGPIQFNSGFGDTAALLLSVASPKENDVEISLRARGIAQALEAERAGRQSSGQGERAAVIVALPRSVNPEITRDYLELLQKSMEDKGFASDIQALDGSGFAGLDMETSADDAAILSFVFTFLQEGLGLSRFQPDAWAPVMIRDPKETETALKAARGDKYSYRELDHFTDLISRNLQSIPMVTIIQRSGVLPEQIFLTYSQEKLAALDLQPSNITNILAARNTRVPGGVLETGGINVLIEPSGPFTDASQLNNVIIAKTEQGSPVYLRSVAEVQRGYQNPPQFLNFYNWRDEEGNWQRSRAVSLAIQMREKEQIAQFGAAVSQVLATVKQELPEDLIMSRVSDQPLQVKENIDLFMTALYEAVALVVLVAFLGFWEWRSAFLMMLSMPITLAMTFGAISALGIEMQQVSVASLIIALGLLVDDPVVAGDAIKRELAAGKPRIVAAWLGPTKLAHAILFATITNVVAYIPFLTLTGNTGDFLYSLPVVMAAALISSRIVSMTFVPLLGYVLLRPRKRPEPTMEERRSRGFTGFYFRLGSFAIRHRKLVFVASLSVLALGGFVKSELKNSFFPNDIQYLFYADVWLRNDAPLEMTDRTVQQVEAIILEVIEDYKKSVAAENGSTPDLLESISSFVGGGAPRFWFSVTPQLKQVNYAQVLVRGTDKDATPHLVGPLQEALSSRVAGAIVDVQQLQTNPVPYPIEIRIIARATIDAAQEAKDIRTLRQLTAGVEEILRTSSLMARVRNDWGNETLRITYQIDPDRANLAGVTNQDVAISSVTGISGSQVTTVQDGYTDVPVIARMRSPERAQLSDLHNLYVFSTEDKNKVPLLDIATVSKSLRTERFQRLDHFRTVSVRAFPVPGALSSEAMAPVLERLDDFAKSMPPGFTMVIGGEHSKTKTGFGNLITIMIISGTLIYIALVIQFKSAIKPVLVFMAVPYGMAGAVCGLYVMGESFSFMGFLGIIALIGVIVSHVIVLFDFVEVMRERGEPLEQGLLDAGIVRLRPVMITVGATVLALFPLAIHGGPLWQPLAYAQIGGLTVATFITLLLVPVLYSIFVLDLKIIRWEPPEDQAAPAVASAPRGP